MLVIYLPSCSPQWLLIERPTGPTKPSDPVFLFQSGIQRKHRHASWLSSSSLSFHIASLAFWFIWGTPGEFLKLAVQENGLEIVFVACVAWFACS